MTPYSLVKDVQAEAVCTDNRIIVSIQTKSKIEYRAIYAGQANCRFWWKKVGKSGSWVFGPTILNPETIEAEQSQTADGKCITKIQLNEISDSSGFLDPHFGHF